MKKIILSFVFLFVLVAHSSAYLLSDGGEVSDFNALQLYKRQNVSVGFEVSNYLYEEPGVMKLTGTKYGLCAEYVNRRFSSGFKNSNIVFNAVQIRFMTGDVDYDGALQGEVKTPYRCSGIKDYYLETRELQGLVIRGGANSHLEWCPFLGFGVRFLCNDFGADPKGYDRRSMYMYLPIGVTLKRCCKKGLAFDICGEFDWMFFGLQQSNMKAITTVARNIQTKGYGLRLSGKISKEIKKVVFFVGPFVRYWDISESDKVEFNTLDKDGNPITGVILEPKNYTLEWGAQLGVSF